MFIKIKTKNEKQKNCYTWLSLIKMLHMIPVLSWRSQGKWNTLMVLYFTPFFFLPLHHNSLWFGYLMGRCGKGPGSLEVLPPHIIALVGLVLCVSLISMSLTLFFKELLLSHILLWRPSCLRQTLSKDLRWESRGGKPMQSSIWAFQIKVNQCRVENLKTNKQKT